MRRRRAILATVFTVIVLALLVAGWVSLPVTVPFSDFNHGNDVAAFDSSDADQPDGIELGDRVSIADQTNFGTRVAIVLGQAHAGMQLPVTAAGGVPRRVTAESRTSTPVIAWILCVISALFAMFGLFVLWRGRDRVSLWLGLFCLGIAAPLVAFYAALPPAAALAAYVVDIVLELLAYYALFRMAVDLTHAELSARPGFGKLSVWMRRVAVAVIGLAGVGSVVPILAHALWAQGGTVLAALAQIGSWAAIAAQFLVLTAFPAGLLAAGARLATDPRRSQLWFVAWTMLLALAPPLTVGAFEVMRGREPVFGPQWLTIVAIPLGLAYAIPRYRFIDIALVNRVVINAVLTTLLGLAITAFETLADKVIHPSEAHESENVYASFVLAFFIVMTVKQFHERLETAVEELVFRGRREALESLDLLARHALRYDDREALLERVVAQVCTALDASAVGVYEWSAMGFALSARAPRAAALPERVDAGDCVVAALKDFAALDLGAGGATGSAFGVAGIVLPLGACGQLLGALACGPRQSDFEGTYDEKERAALGAVAERVGETLYLLASPRSALRRKTQMSGATRRAGSQRARLSNVSSFHRHVAAGDTNAGLTPDTEPGRAGDDQRLP
jgi:hypothetical protein